MCSDAPLSFGKGCVESDGELPKSFLLYEKEEENKKTKRAKHKKEKNKETVVCLSKLASGVLVSRTARVKDESEEDTGI